MMSNTWVDLTRAGEGHTPGLGWGWLSGTVRCGIDQVRELMRPYGEWSELKGGLGYYSQAARVGTDGISVAWSPRIGLEKRADEVFVNLTQRACDALGIDQVRELARKLSALGVHWTRADVYYDDHKRHAEPAEVIAAFRAGQRVSHIRKSALIDGGEDGSTAYLGKRGDSDVLVRAYDKDAEQGTKRGTHGVRWEVQGRREHAAYLVETVLFAGPAELGQALARVMCGLVDFRDRQGLHNGQRGPRLSWWAALVGEVRAAKRAVVKVPDSLVRRAWWIRKQVAPTLGLLLQAAGGDVGWLLAVAESGLGRLERSELLLLPPELRPVWFEASA